MSNPSADMPKTPVEEKTTDSQTTIKDVTTLAAAVQEIKIIQTNTMKVANTAEPTASPFQITEPYRSNPSTLRDWKRKLYMPVKIGDKLIIDLFKQDNNVQTPDFEDNEHLKTFFKNHLIDHIDLDKQEKMGDELIQTLHQGGLLNPLRDIIARTLVNKSYAKISTDQRSPEQLAQDRIDAPIFSKTDKGFRIKEVVTHKKLLYTMVDASGGGMLEKEIHPDTGEDYLYKAEIIIDVDCSGDSLSYTVIKNTIDYGNDTIKKILNEDMSEEAVETSLQALINPPPAPSESRQTDSVQQATGARPFTQSLSFLPGMLLVAVVIAAIVLTLLTTFGAAAIPTIGAVALGILALKAAFPLIGILGLGLLIHTKQQAKKNLQEASDAAKAHSMHPLSVPSTQATSPVHPPDKVASKGTTNQQAAQEVTNSFEKEQFKALSHLATQVSLSSLAIKDKEEKHGLDSEKEGSAPHP